MQQIQAFKREQALEPDADPDTTVVVADFDDEIDLRAVDDALIAAELDAEAEAAAVAAVEEEDGEDEDDKPKRRRGRRGGRSSRAKRRAGLPFEATFDHGEEGIGLWLDPAVQDDPVYAEYWAGHRPVEVTIEENQIVIRRVGGEEPEESEESEPPEDSAPPAKAHRRERTKPPEATDPSAEAEPTEDDEPTENDEPSEDDEPSEEKS